MEELITYFNVQIMGLKPFHLNFVKTPLLVFGVVGFLWATLVKSSQTQLDTFIRFCRGWSYKRTILLLSAGLAGGLLWLSLLQFYSFLSAGYDLSIYSNAIWHTAHGQWFFDSVKNEHLLGDHFGPILAILAPLYWIWESPIWLLIVQSIAI